MATRFPSARNFSASQITTGVLPVPPTVRFPTLMTGAFRRFCLSHLFAYSQILSLSNAPETTESGHNSLRRRGDTFIELCHPDALRFLRQLDLPHRANLPQVVPRLPPSFSCALGRETILSRLRRHLLGSRPERPLRLPQNVKQFLKSFPSKAQTPVLCRRRPALEYCDHPKIRAILRRRLRPRAHRAKPVHRCCRAARPSRLRRLANYRGPDRCAIALARELPIWSGG